MAMMPARMPRSVQPAAGLRLLSRRDGAAAPRSYSSSSSSAGRSSSRDGTPSPRVKAATPTGSSSVQGAPASATPADSSIPQTARSLSPGPKQSTQAKKRSTSQVNKRAFELPHVRKSLVGLDAFFATHRPLLELPLRLGARRSTAAGGASDSAYVPRDDSSADSRLLGRRTQAENDLVQVVDQAEDGSTTGEPYLVRLSETEPLRSVEEELAAEAVEEAEMAQQEELQHEMEATEDRPYEPWLLGQYDTAVQDVNVARYLAVRPPFTAPSPAGPSPKSASQTQELDFIAPFQPTTSSSASPAAVSSTDYSTTFSSHFVEPLSPNEATGAVDRFLSHHEVLYRWSAQTDFVNAAGEALRRASQSYSPAATASPAPVSSPVLDALRKQRGSVRLWSDADGFVSVPVGLHLDSTLSPFLPAEEVIVEDIQMDSVKRKRQKKIRKHKHRKRRKAQRALRQKLGK
ncbi:hypothetical protein JCM10908_005415 [Rhodotorula pacifica]|uniref:mitochondrial 37S ribosomal protein mS38 QRI5 n=1 Tax=Rhodotorula pacifica TaxID=1495444 RepID=UPI00316E0AD2